MRRSTFSVMFFIKRNAPKRNDLNTLMVRLTIDGKQIQFSSKIDIEPILWNQRHNKVMGDDSQVRIINEMINSVRFDLHRHYKQNIKTLNRH